VKAVAGESKGVPNAYVMPTAPANPATTVLNPLHPTVLVKGIVPMCNALHGKPA
jgi:hypothetical protein